ncbi:MAG TPA: hypothetical protein DDW45_07320 [Gammaproteobacteria bacterium]|nr:hypothetical protein [Gammaproteobacteria bacterium]
MGDIARITVEKEQGLLRSMMREVPAMQAHAILGIQEDILIGESPLCRCLDKCSVREKNHRRLSQIHTTIQQGHPKQQEQDIFYHSVFHVDVRWIMNPLLFHSKDSGPDCTTTPYLRACDMRFSTRMARAWVMGGTVKLSTGLLQTTGDPLAL